MARTKHILSKEFIEGVEVQSDIFIFSKWLRHSKELVMCQA